MKMSATVSTYSTGLTAPANPAKRQRTDSMGGFTLNNVDYDSIIKLLPPAIVHDLLVSAAKECPEVGERIISARDQLIAAERAKVIDFDRYSKSAWYTLNVAYSRLSGSKQFDKSGEAANDVVDTIESIANATPGHASYGTKKSALETLRKIGKSICLSCTDVIGHEVVKHFQYETCLEKTMLQIAKGMTAAEHADMMRSGEFEVKLRELEDLAKDHCIFEKLPKVRKTLMGQNGEAEGDEGEDEEEYEEDDESTEGEEDTYDPDDCHCGRPNCK